MYTKRHAVEEMNQSLPSGAYVTTCPPQHESWISPFLKVGGLVRSSLKPCLDCQADCWPPHFRPLQLHFSSCAVGVEYRVCTCTTWMSLSKGLGDFDTWKCWEGNISVRISPMSLIQIVELLCRLVTYLKKKNDRTMCWNSNQTAC